MKKTAAVQPRQLDMGKPFELALDKIALDPNNPRIAPKPAPGYADPASIFDPALQARLVVEVYDKYKAADLEGSIIEQGWTPVDQILVWEHPNGKGYIVVEGNARVSLLKRLPERLVQEQKRLERLVKAGAPQPQVNPQTVLIAKVEQLLPDTRSVTVYPVNLTRRLSIATPEDATPVWRLGREADSHREQNTPIKALNDLLNGLKQTKPDTLIAQSEHLRSMLEQAVDQIGKYIRFIDDNAVT